MSFVASAYIYHLSSSSDNVMICLSYLHQIKIANVWVRSLAQRSLQVGYGDWESNPELPAVSHAITLEQSQKQRYFFIILLLCVRGLAQMG